MAKLFPPKSSIWAAGGVVVRTRKGKREYLLVHRPRYNDWSLPKGKLDGKESFEAAAVREVREETGRRGVVVASLGTIAYNTKRRNHKVVRYWLMEEDGGSFRTNREVDKIVWLTANKARHVMSYNRDREVLRWAHVLSTRPKAGRVYLVRHADARPKGSWRKNDAKRPLSKRGKRQASDLEVLLTRAPVTGVYSSDRRRTEQTVSGLASALGLKLKPQKSLRESADLDTIASRISAVKGEAQVVCTHGEVVGEYIDWLVANGLEPLAGAKWQKGSVWTLGLRKGEVTAAMYTPPIS